MHELCMFTQIWSYTDGVMAGMDHEPYKITRFTDSQPDHKKWPTASE